MYIGCLSTVFPARFCTANSLKHAVTQGDRRRDIKIISKELWRNATSCQKILRPTPQTEGSGEPSAVKDVVILKMLGTRPEKSVDRGGTTKT